MAHSGLGLALSDPSLWSYGAKALLDPSAPLHIPARIDPKLWQFLARFGMHANQRAWTKAMCALTPIDQVALEAFDELQSQGVIARTNEGPFIVGFERGQESVPFVHEIHQVEKAGQVVPLHRLKDPRSMVPHLSDKVSTVLTMDGQRFIEPGL